MSANKIIIDILKKAVSITAALCLGAVLMPSVQRSSKISAQQDSKLIALTFDDGPNLTTTQDVLDILEQYGAKATFFLIGNNINDATAASVRRAHDMGCEIANHSKSHVYLSEMSDEEMKNEVDYVDDYVYRITGDHTKFFRAPFLNTSDRMYEVIDQTFICGVNCEDCSTQPQGRADAVMSAAKDGLIVLMHDFEGNTATSEALKIAIPALQKQGYEFVTLSELFRRQGEKPLGDRTYSDVSRYPCGGYEKYKNIFTGEATGESSWSGWSQISALDKNELVKLGDDYAVEVHYDSKSTPVLVVQKWSGDWLWQAVPPCYSNGSRACFLASDLNNALDELKVSLTDLDQISIAPYGTPMTITSIDILKKSTGGTQTEKIKGDVNSDGSLSAADAVMMLGWMTGKGELTDPEAGDFDNNDIINIYDFIMLKNSILTQ